jgi:hypothetical protein
MRMYIARRWATTLMVLLFAVLEQSTSPTLFPTPSWMNHTSTPAESALVELKCAPFPWTLYPGVPTEIEAGRRYRRDRTVTHLPALC